MFSIINNLEFKKRSDVQIVLKRVFLSKTNLHGLNFEPLTEAVWIFRKWSLKDRDMFGRIGKGGLNKYTITCLILLYELKDNFDRKVFSRVQFYLDCLGTILLIVNNKGARLNLSPVDLGFIEGAIDYYKDISEVMRQDPEGDMALMLDDFSQSADVSKAISFGYLVKERSSDRGVPINAACDEIEVICARIKHGFTLIADCRGEELDDYTMLNICFVLVHVNQNFGQKFFDEHLAYELERYRSDGLRESYLK